MPSITLISKLSDLNCELKPKPLVFICCSAMAYARPSLQGIDVDANVGQHALFNGGSSDPKDGLHGRAYQYEMLEESMKRNIIIAAETGSGKTLMLVPLSQKKAVF